MVKEAVQNFLSLPRINLLGTLSNGYLEKLTAALLTADSKIVKPLELELDSAGQETSVCIVASMENLDDVASAFLLLKYLARRLAMLPDLMPYVLSKDVAISSEVKLVIALFGSTSMEDPVFLRGLSPLRFREAIGAIPVIADAHFHFPSQDHIFESCVKVFGDDGQSMSGFIVHVFKEIACLFHPRTASSELIAVQAYAIADRIRNPRFAKTSVCSSDGGSTPVHRGSTISGTNRRQRSASSRGSGKKRGSAGLASRPSGSSETAPPRPSGSADAS
eukprot:5439724-Amphidinium_carterae.1